MDNKLTIIQVIALNNQAWVLHGPLNERPTSMIRGMVRVGSTVEIFAQNPNDPTKGDWLVLAPPLISTVVSLGEVKDWTALLGSMPDDVPKVSECTDVAGGVWRVGEPMPGEGSNKIAAMFMIDEMISVFIAPAPGSEFAQQGLALHVTLMPLTWSKGLMTDLPAHAWGRLMNSAIAAAQAEVDDDDLDEEENGEEEPEDEPEPEIARPRRAPAAAAAPVPPPAPQPVAPLPTGPALQNIITSVTNGASINDPTPVGPIPPEPTGDGA